MNILLAVDGSEFSRAAASELRSRPWPPGSAVRVLTAVRDWMPLPPSEMLGGGVGTPDAAILAQEYADFARPLHGDAEALVNRVADSIRGRDIVVDKAVRHGDVRQAILDEAERWPADL